jgi:hypothetical protein
MTGSIEAQNGKGELLAFGQIGKGMEPGWDLRKANKPLNPWLNLGKNAKGGYSCDGSCHGLAHGSASGISLMPRDESFSFQRVFILISLSLATRIDKNGVQTVACEAAFQGVNGCAAHDWGQIARPEGKSCSLRRSFTTSFRSVEALSVRCVVALCAFWEPASPDDGSHAG